MTDEEIETTLQRNAANIGGGFNVEALDYINRLKAEKKRIRKDTAKEILQKWAHHNAMKGDEDGYVYHTAEDYDVEVDDE